MRIKRVCDPDKAYKEWQEGGNLPEIRVRYNINSAELRALIAERSKPQLHPAIAALAV